jgi:choline kinase
MKVCLLAAGKGTRNSSIKGLHKALLPIQNKPAISYIIDKIPTTTDIVIAVGYKSKQIKTYINNIYKDRKITFVDIDNYDGDNSGPGYSLLCCEIFLQEPFIFTSIDTIIEEEYPYLECTYNWIGASKVEESESHRYCLIGCDSNNHFNELYYGKGEYAYTGIAGIYDYDHFWHNLKNPTIINNEHQVIDGFKGLNLQILKHTWYDIGNTESYNIVRQKFNKEVVANKNNETLLIDNGIVTKFFDDADRITQRIARCDFIPNTNIKLINENMYSYDYIQGYMLSDIYDERIFKKFLQYYLDNFYKYNSEKDEIFINNCKLMYQEKTLNRLAPLLGSDLDQITYINGLEVKPLKQLLNDIDWRSIYSKAIPVRFHGDLQPENILYNIRNKEFSIIDWRESFGSSIEFGDAYYDLSKIYHGLLINGTTIMRGYYGYSLEENRAEVSFMIKNNLYNLKNIFKKFCKNNKFCWQNIKLLAIIHYMSICNLYRDFDNNKYGDFLFLYSKYLLAKYKEDNDCYRSN